MIRYVFACCLLALLFLPPAAQAAPPSDCALLQRQIRTPISPSDQAPAQSCLTADTLWWYQQSSVAYAATLVFNNAVDQAISAQQVRTAAIGWHTVAVVVPREAVVLALIEQRATQPDLTVWYEVPQPPTYLPFPLFASERPCVRMLLRPIAVPIALSMCGAVESQRPDGRTMRIAWQTNATIDLPARMELLDATGAVLWSKAYTASGRTVERLLLDVPVGAAQFQLCEQWAGCAAHDLPPWWVALPMAQKDPGQ